jgi:glutathione S-transferase
VVEYLDRHGSAPPLIPAARDAALWTRIWDRVMDGYVMTPMQAIVFDALRPAGDKDPYGVASARAKLDGGWLAGETFTLADCAAGPALHYADVVHPIDRGAHPALSAYLERLLARPSVARVIDEARPYRELFPLPWPAHVT